MTYLKRRNMDEVESLEHLRKERCSETGKVCFHKKEALSKVKFLEYKGREKRLRIYQCPHCDWWHLTKSFSTDRRNKDWY